MIIRSEKVMKRKAIFLFIVFICGFLYLIGNLTYIVMVEGKNYDLAVLRNATKREEAVELNDKRGQITDRNGIVLADSITTYHLIFDPKLLKSLKPETQTATIDYLVDKLGYERGRLETILEKNADSNNITLGNPYSYAEFKEVKNDIDNYRVKGIFYNQDYERLYPYPEIASTIIGFVDGDNNGRTGVEASFNEYLIGDSGRTYGSIDEDNMLEIQEISAIDGANVELTIDFTIQKYIREAIDQFYEDDEAKAVHVIVMDPRNGEVLGMGSTEEYSLENPYDVISYVDDETYQNMSEQDKLDKLYQLWSNDNASFAYEPGSTYKPFVYATVLEENKVNLQDTYTCHGHTVVADTKINCWKVHGEQTLQEALENSCNMAFIELGHALGRSTYDRYRAAFGFGSVTGLELQEERSLRGSTYMHMKDMLNPVELATESFGQTLYISPIQLITGFSALINGGDLYEAHLMRKVYTEDQLIISDNVNRQRQVISEEVSKLTKKALQSVVDEGTGAKAKIAGYEIGGKTGTAEKKDRDDQKYVVSFIGFAPVEDPQIITLVVVDEPVLREGERRFTSRFAAGVFVDVMEETMPYLHIFKAEDPDAVSDDNEGSSLIDVSEEETSDEGSEETSDENAEAEISTDEGNDTDSDGE